MRGDLGEPGEGQSVADERRCPREDEKTCVVEVVERAEMQAVGNLSQLGQARDGPEVAQPDLLQLAGRHLGLIGENLAAVGQLEQAPGQLAGHGVLQWAEEDWCLVE